MKKQIKIVALTAVALLGASALAGATELNMYGASAEYTYWSAQAQNYLQNNLGCSSTFNNTVGTTSAGVSPGVTGVACYATQGTSCTSSLTDGTVNFRYCSNSSVTGIQSAGGFVAADGCTDPTQRKMINPDATNTVSCNTVHIGTSDVKGESFTQASSGNKVGPLGGGSFSASYSGQSTSGLTGANTIVVPFGFFVNKAVTAKQCTAGLVGNYCTTNAQCDTANAAGNGVCNTTPTTITNLSRLQAVQLFAGYVGDWSQFGGYFTSQPVVLCLRHAGSGTHATLDYAVVSAGTTGWGNSLVQFEDQIGPPAIWFNNGSGDEIKCINGNNTVAGSYGYSSGSANGASIGAIGYADGDQALGAANTSQNIAQVKYQGYYPTRTHIRNGEYEFYSPGWVYYKTGASNASLIQNLITYAQNPANVPSTKANYWAALGEMAFVKDSDKSYPNYVGASTVVSP